LNDVSISVGRIGAERADATNSNRVDLEALRRYRLERIREQLSRLDCAGIVVFDPINIRYATDVTNMQVWVLHNAARYAFVATSGPVVLFDFHNCEHLAAGVKQVDEVRRATSWYYFHAGPRLAELAGKWAAEIADLVHAHGGGNRRLAVDHCNPEGAAALARHGLTVHDGQEVMEQARVIKAPVEIEAMRVAIAACETGMRRMQEALQPGISENELWSVLHQTNIALGGEWIETRLLSSGPRTNPWFQECGTRIIQDGDIVSFDTDLIGPFGYCADISRSWRCGDGAPDDRQRRLYALAREQIEFNIELLRPGMRFDEFAARSFRLPANCVANRYSVVAHGVGLCDEYPAVSYMEDTANRGYTGTIEPGMTLCIESYIGEDGGSEGMKLEEQVLVTEHGVERLSVYPFEDRFA